MGTSTSSKGGASGSPFDPAWLAPAEKTGSDPGGSPADAPDHGEPDADGNGNGAESDKPEVQNDNGGASSDAGTVDGPSAPAGVGDAPGESLTAQSRRFAAARTNMSSYLSGGGRESLRSAAKNMVNKGMGGPRRAASTMRGTSRGAGQLGQFLALARDGSDPQVRDWVQRVKDLKLSAPDLILELVREVLPDTGSVDDESLRNAAAEALGEVYEAAPDMDVFNLTDDQISEVIGLTVANDVCNRMHLQLGQTYERLKLSPPQVQLYLNDVKEYVHAEVRVVMEQHSALKMDPKRLAREVLASTLKVFAE